MNKEDRIIQNVMNDINDNDDERANEGENVDDIDNKEDEDYVLMSDAVFKNDDIVENLFSVDEMIQSIIHEVADKVVDEREVEVVQRDGKRIMSYEEEAQVYHDEKLKQMGFEWVNCLPQISSSRVRGKSQEQLKEEAQELEIQETLRELNNKETLIANALLNFKELTRFVPNKRKIKQDEKQRQDLSFRRK